MDTPEQTASTGKIDPTLQRYLGLAYKVAYVMLFLGLALTLVNWLIPEPNQFLAPDWMQMQSNTALAILMAASIPLTLLFNQQAVGLGARIALALVALVILMNSLLLLANDGATNALNHLLVSGVNAGRVFPISYQSILCIALLVVTPFFDSPTSKALSEIHDLLCMVIFALLIFFASSYVFNAVLFVRQDDNVLLSLHTLIALLLLAFINIAGKQAPGFFDIFISIGSGAELSRVVLFPAILLAFFVLTILQDQINRGYISLAESFAFMTAIMVAGFGFLLIFMSRRINELENQLNNVATRDELTGLLNRRGFDHMSDQVLKAARRRNKAIQLLYFDLDNLKLVNNKFGHSVGSEILRIFSQSLLKVFRQSDIVSRYGGDEFLVLTELDKDDVPAVIEKLDKRIAQYAEYSTLPEYSYGAVEIRAIDNMPIEVVLEKAEALMYEDKKRCKETKERAGASYSI